MAMLARSGAQTNSTAILEQPLSLVEAIDLALRKNPTILQAEKDLQANQGVVVQTRASLYPRLQGFGDYREKDPGSIDRTIEKFVPIEQNERLWSTDIRLIQSVYEGGRMLSALRTSRLLRQKALLDYRATVNDVLLRVRIAYAEVLATSQKIEVVEASLRLLEKQLQDVQHRFNNGLEPRFSVLRAEVELANTRPQLIQARNVNRISKQELVHLLGFELPPSQETDLPLLLTDKLKEEPFSMSLGEAVEKALLDRVEIESQRKETELREQGVKTARSTYKPSLQAFAGYGTRNSEYTRDLLDRVTGWNAGVQLNWVPFDGFLTKGKVQEAKARHEKALLQLDDLSELIKLDVRNAYSYWIEAREILQSQGKVIEQAEESLRLATARQENGTATQLDVLSAQTALTQARSNQVDALRNYVVALARLERAIGK